MTSLPAALASEISRVTEIKEQYISMRGRPQINVEPVIFLISNSIDTAVLACAEGDIAGMAKALADLRGYAN